MIITLSPAFMEGRAFPEDHIREVARQVGVHYRVKWANERSARGVLTKAAGSYVNASDAEHDRLLAGSSGLIPRRMSGRAWQSTTLWPSSTRACP